MNGIRLPDPIIPNQDPFTDKNKSAYQKNNDREVKFEQLKNTAPRYPRTFDIKNDPVSTIRLINNVPQTHALGRNVYRRNDETGIDKSQNKPETNQGRKIPVSNRFCSHNYEPKSVNYDSLYEDLNKTIESYYNERISSVDSFEYTYYRHNDPDNFQELKYNEKHRRNNQNQSSNHAGVNDRDRERNYEYLCKGQKGPDRMSNYMKNTSKDGINQQGPNRRNVGNTTNTTIANTSISNGINESDVGGNNLDSNNKTEFDYTNHYCELTKEELFNGLSSIGLGLSKVFSLTGKGVLYLCSSISDNAEGLLDKENNQYKGCNFQLSCKCHPFISNRDLRNLPDLHINYESCCPRDYERNDCTEHQGAVFVNGKRAEVNRNYMNNRYSSDRDYMTYNKDNYHRNGNYTGPNEYDKRYINQQNSKMSANNANFTIDYETDLEYYDGHIPKGANMYNPYENQTGVNLYRERDISRAIKVNNNNLAKDYSFDNCFNGPQYDFKNTAPANHPSNYNQFDNKSAHPAMKKLGTSNINAGRTKFKGENLNAHGFDKYKTVDLSEKIRKNTDIPNFGKPSVSAYGSNTNESEYNGKGPSIRTWSNNISSNIFTRNSINTSSSVTGGNLGGVENITGRGVENARLTRGGETQSINLNNEDSNINKSKISSSLNKYNEQSSAINLNREIASAHRTQNENNPNIVTNRNKEINNKLSIKDVNLSELNRNSLSDFGTHENVARISMSDTSSNTSLGRISLSETDSSSSGSRSSTTESDTSSSDSGSSTSGSSITRISTSGSSITRSSDSGSSISGTSLSGSDSSSVVSKNSTIKSESVRSENISSKAGSEPEVEGKKKAKKRIFPFYKRSKN